MADFLHTPEQLALRHKMAGALHEKWQLTNVGKHFVNTYAVIDDLRDVSPEFDLLFNPEPQVLLAAIPEGWSLIGIEWEAGQYVVGLLSTNPRLIAEGADEQWQVAWSRAIEQARKVAAS